VRKAEATSRFLGMNAAITEEESVAADYDMTANYGAQ
jgi:hypothetical protein